MRTQPRLRHVAVAAALLSLAACGLPRLRRVPGSDLASPHSARPSVTGSGRSCGGQPRVGVAGPNVTVGDATGACATATTDTVPDPSAQKTDPRRPVP
jgi:predicted small lipoprotein YifL